jgi:hypothetical protein
MSLHGEPKRRRSRSGKIAWPRALPKRTRQIVEEAIERHHDATEALLALLDEADGDPELEPSLSGNGGYGMPTGHELEGDDSELDVSYSEAHGRGGQIGSSDHDDAECSLGWSEGADQARSLSQCGGYLRMAGEWIPANDDREAEHDGREPDADREPQCEDEGAQSDDEPPSEPFTTGGELPI